MIPKKIHYCWFGNGDIPKSALRCIESWKKMMPDAEIIRWDESNYGVTKNTYMKEAYESKKYAFVSDYARLDIVYNEGGIYLDVDVELIKPIGEEFLRREAFFGFQTRANNGQYYINTGLGFGACKGNVLIKKIMDDYEGESFVNSDGSLNTVSCPTRNSIVFLNEGFELTNTKQVINNIAVYPATYFCPIDEQTGKKEIVKNTVSIHHFNASWLDTSGKIKRALRIIVGARLWNTIKKIVRR